MRTATPGITLLLFVAVCASSAGAVCKLTTGEGCTVRDVYDAAFEEAIGRETAENSELVRENALAAEGKVRDAPAATTAPSSFAGRIHGSYEDFLNTLAFALNSVEESEDGQALVVRLNPIRTGSHRLGFSLTVSEPKVGREVSEAISDAGRSDAITLLSKQLADFDDLTIAAAYTYQTANCSFDLNSRRRCFGRDPAIYRSALSNLIPDPVSTLIDSAAKLLVVVPDPEPGKPVFDRVLSSDPKVREVQRESIAELAQTDALATKQEVEDLKEAGTDLFWPLVDNQPQIAVTWSKRNADVLVGQEYDALALEVQFGGANVNSLFRGCSVGDAGCARARLVALAKRKAESGAKLTDGKWVLSASHLQRKRYSLAELPLADSPGVFTPIDLPESSEFKAKLQWGALVATKVGGWTPRVDFSAEGLETRDDGVRTKNRWVATATLTLPIADGVTIPISLNYANKPEFLAESEKTFGAHVGLSYRLPFGDPPSVGGD